MTTMAKRQHLIPIKLSDVPLEQRMHAARVAVKTCAGDETNDVFVAALFPSEKVYWVRADAIEQERDAA